MHGQNKHVKANQAARKAVAQAAAYGDVEVRSPAESLMAAGSALDFSLQALEQLVSTAGAVDPMLLKEIRAAATESGKMQKMIQDAGLDERRLRLEEQQQVQLGDVVRLVLEAHGLAVTDAAVRADLGEALRKVAVGDRSPLRPVLALETGVPVGS